MNAPLAALPLRHARWLLVAALALALAACSTPGSRSAPSALKGEHCADLVVAALTSSQPVSGAFACQSAGLQAGAQAAGISDDASLSAIAQQLWAWNRAVDVAATGDGAFIYELFSPTANPTILVVYTDSDGLVSRFIRNDNS